MVDQLTTKLVQKALSRRGFLASAGAVTAATMVGCGNSSTFTPQQPVVPTPAVTIADADVLNFALNLEYLEATFYLYAATGKGLSAADSLGGGAVTITSASQVNFGATPLIGQFAAELAQTELQHVRALQAAIKALGGTPIAAPAIDLMNSFNAIAQTALISGGTFNPFSSPQNFVVAASSLERVGLSAYTGAADLISNATILSAAAGIQAAEAYHTGASRMLLANDAVTSGNGSAVANLNAINNVIVTLGGGTPVPLTTGLSSGTYSTPTTYAVVDGNALSLARTVDQVMHIVYGKGGGAGVSSGGFFPSGLNGLIKTTAA